MPISTPPGDDRSPDVPSLDRLLRPRSIALVGASENSFYAANTLRNLLDQGFPGRVYPVTPSRNEVFGLPAYPSVGDLPEAPDNVVVVVRRELVPQVVEEAVAKGAGGLTIMSAGFSEAGDAEGDRLHRDVMRAVDGSGLHMVGPNCLGYINAAGATALWSAPLRGGMRAGPVAVVTQSGGSSGALYGSLLERELGVGWFVTAGNQATLEVSDYAEYLVEDADVGILVCFIEGVRDGQRFIRVAQRARALGKPLVVLKTGRSARGREAAFAHTGSMAGSDDVYDAVFRRHGVVRVHDFEELLETVAILSAARHWPKSVGRPAVISVSGGACALVADKAEDHGLELSRLDPGTVHDLREAMPASGNPNNPIDVTGQGLQDRSIYESVLTVLAGDPAVDSVVHVLSSGIPVTGSPAHRAVLDLIVENASTSTQFPILCSLNKQSLTSAQREFIRSHPEIGYVEGLGAGLRAIAHAARFSTPAGHAAAPLDEGTSPDGGDVAARRVLDERQSLSLFDEYGIPTVVREFAATPQDCREAADRVGFPVVLKLVAAGIPHKSRVGGVALGLRSAAEAHDAARAMLERVASRVPDVVVEGFLLQRQAPSGAVEVLLGAVRDAQFGPALVVGAGGVHTELLADRVIIPAPACTDDVRSELRRLRIAELLLGGKHSPGVDVDGLVAAALGLQQLLGDRPDVMDVDINPLLVYPDGVLAVDGLVVENEPSRPL